MTNSTVFVELGDRSYPIVVGHGVTKSLDDHVPRRARCAVVVNQTGIPFSVSSELSTAVVCIPDGEDHKTLATIEFLCREFARIGITRDDVVIAVGGGIVTDVAGFAAASWHRGTAVLHVPTTLLGMVDAAIGGKTAVNIPEGKNLVGAFWQPIAVLCDLDALSTLPEHEMRCGLGEVAKYHFLSGADLLAMSLAERVAECARIKAHIVSADEREGGRRALLNYGHTLAHAIETVGAHGLAHGEAVAVGMIFAARLARSLGRIDDRRVAVHEHVIGDVYGLRTSIEHDLDVDDLMTVMMRDKKAVNGLTFILDSPEGLEVVASIDPAIVRSTLTTFLDQ